MCRKSIGNERCYNVALYPIDFRCQCVLIFAICSSAFFLIFESLADFFIVFYIVSVIHFLMSIPTSLWTWAECCLEAWHFPSLGWTFLIPWTWNFYSSLTSSQEHTEYEIGDRQGESICKADHKEQFVGAALRIYFSQSTSLNKTMSENMDTGPANLHSWPFLKTPWYTRGYMSRYLCI
jgi:hypothetical protein